MDWILLYRVQHYSTSLSGSRKLMEMKYRDDEKKENKRVYAVVTVVPKQKQGESPGHRHFKID